MYPVLFRIGSFDITSFGAMVGLGALVGLWLLSRELRLSGLPAGANDAAIGGLLGGLAGAKLLWTLEHLGEAPLSELLLSRGGLSWFGGLAGGLLIGIAVLVVRRYPVLSVVAAATPALAVGHAIGRIGCFLVGDDYGRPTTLPWGVSFPEGAPPTLERVHPTQLYEAALLMPLALCLIRWRRRGVADNVVLGRYLMLAGMGRFAIEFIRVNVPVAGPFTTAQLASIAIVVIGLVVSLRGHVASRVAVRDVTREAAKR
ncbi:MAG: prolipoprotein diacylglyceryl transferase family protein [Vicinamibacterales bacterium]